MSSFSEDKMRGVVLSVLVVVANLIATDSSQASVSAALDLNELVKRADVVLVATAIDHEVHREGPRIVTDVRLRSERVLKGQLTNRQEVTIRCWGGELGEVGMRVEGEPVFRAGSRYVVFATEHGSFHRAVGMSQGVLPIEAQASGPTMVMPGAQGLVLVEEPRPGALAPAPGALTYPLPLNDLVVRIRQALADPSGR